MQSRIGQVLTARIPAKSRRRMLQWVRRMSNPARLGILHRTTPVSDRWGFDRGTPVDRYYIARFLEENRQDIHGRVLEIKDSGYTELYGYGVENADVLDIDASNPHATIVADLCAADMVPSNSYDCFVLTQTLQFMPEIGAALSHAHRILCTGGVLLATLPGLSRVERAYAELDYWRFTPASCQLLFGKVFGAGQVRVRSYGNVLAAVAFLAGMASEELSERDLESHDDLYPVVLAVRAVK